MTDTQHDVDQGTPAAMDVKAGHLALAGSAITAGVLLFSQVDVVEFATYLGLATLISAVIGDIYCRLGRFNLFSMGRR